jgi:thymidylate synthase ThyX
MPFNRRIYRLSPSQLSAETIAVTFAKTSRSPKAFDEIAAELDVEKSSQFSEKWIVGYGHSSVAEHAILHLALENVSRLAIEMIEGNRLASYTEKSTRYQEWNREAYVIPPEIQGSRFETLYIDTLGQLFDAYEHAIPLVKQVMASNDPQRSDEKEKAWNERIRTASIDVCRFLLPAASVANVGVTINARSLEYAIRKLLSSDLAEVRMIGEEVKVVATQEVPTLVKYATPLSYMTQVKQAIEPFLEPVVDKPTSEMCRLVEYDPMGEQKVLAGLLYRFGQGSFTECQQKISKLSFEEQQSLVGKIFSEATPFDTPPRELEYTSYVFDMIMDQGAFFEFKRHRMMSQTPQVLTTRLGFAVPNSIIEAGCADQYIAAMQQAASTFEIIAAEMPAVASYVVPNGYNRRVLFELNLRELFHFIRIRCNPNAHFSIRRVGRAMIEKIQPVHPMFCTQLCVDCTESSETISQKYFSSLAKD